MIDSISLADKANFGPVPEKLLNLSAANFIYGANGTGKTTISRVIADEAGHQSCSVSWKGPKLETLVYNRDFVESNFKVGEGFKGIFTLGQADAETMTEIEALQVRAAALDEVTSNEKHRHEILGEELSKIEETFRSKCWDTKEKHIAPFKKAFEGSMRSRQAFLEKVIEQEANNRSELKSVESLKKRAETVYSDSALVVESLAEINFGRIGAAEKNPLLRKSIVGRKDLDISGLILRLDSSNWVNAGRSFLSGSEGVCPFCQCPAPATLEGALNDFFDKTFDKESKAISELRDSFRKDFDVASDQINIVLSNASPFLQHADLTSLNKEFTASANGNLGQLELKSKELSRVIPLRSMADILARLDTCIKNANQQIAEHNKMVNAKKSETAQLTSDVWRLLLDNDLKASMAEYRDRKAKIIVERSSVSETLRGYTELLLTTRLRLTGLKSTLSRTQPTADNINLILKRCGFSRFTISPSDQEGFYKLLREDGSEATNTLSEGERTFVTFLYFYHWMKSKHDDLGLQSGLVVAIDDPVSSLDSDVLFIVSTLIRDCLRLIDDGKGRIRQLLFFTHNVYFHKEVTLPKGDVRKIFKKATFWIIRKTDSHSRIVSFKENPIKTSYELLWSEVKRPKQERSNIALQNSMRRILENYAALFAGTKIENIWENFEGDERALCRSLISWLNDGSHSSGDALNIAMDDAVIETSLKVFREIFVSLGHQNHFDHMMRQESV